jgi:hypothetical protein
MKGGQIWNDAKIHGKTNAQMRTLNSIFKLKEKICQYAGNAGQI